jgi:hypothetical protein
LVRSARGARRRQGQGRGGRTAGQSAASPLIQTRIGGETQRPLQRCAHDPLKGGAFTGRHNEITPTKVGQVDVGSRPPLGATDSLFILLNVGLFLSGCVVEQNYSARLPQILFPLASAGTFSGLSWSDAGSGFGPTSIRTADGPNSWIGEPRLVWMPLSIKIDRRRSAAAFPRCEPTPAVACTTTPSKNAKPWLSVPVNLFHPAWSNMNRICCAVLLGSKSEGDTTTNEISENGFSASAVSPCSNILGEIAASNCKFFSRNLTVSLSSSDIRRSPFLGSSSTRSGSIAARAGSMFATATASMMPNAAPTWIVECVRCAIASRCGRHLQNKLIQRTHVLSWASLCASIVIATVALLRSASGPFPLNFGFTI